MDIYLRKRNSTWSMLLVGAFFFGFLIGFAFCYAFFVPYEEAEPGAQFAASPQNVVQPATPPSTPEAAAPPPEEPEPQPTPSPPEPVSPETPETPPPELEDLEEVEDTWAARHFFVAVSGTKLDDQTRLMLAEVKPGGVVLTAENLENKIQTIALVKSIKDTVGLGKETDDLPLIAVSVDSGAMADAPNAADVGQHRDLEYARRAGFEFAESSIRARGIGVLLGPSLDVYTGGAPDAVPVTSFGSDYRVVSSLGLAFAEGVTQGKVIPVVMHFPGLGAATGDGHDTVAVLPDSVPLGEVMFPFNEAAMHEIPGILVGHVATPERDADNPERPASLSPKLVKELLRGTWNYGGVVIADDLAARAITRSHSPEEAAVLAFAAGCDAAILREPNPDRIRAVVEAVDAAAVNGALDRRSLSASKKRLDAWQQWLRKPAPGLKGTIPVLPPLEVASAPGTGEPAGPEPVARSTYTAARGDSLFKIANAHGVTVNDLREWNNLRGSTLRVGQTLVVSPPVAAAPSEEVVAPKEDIAKAPETPAPPAPVAAEPAPSAGTEEPASTKALTHKVKAGEYLASIADTYDVDYKDIMAWNKLTGTDIYAGQNLTIYVSTDTVVPPVEETYTVQRGDFLGKIADEYGVTVNELMDWNGLKSTNLSIGQKLVIRRQ